MRATGRRKSSTARWASRPAPSRLRAARGRRALRAREDARALGSGADERHVDVELPLHELDIAPGGGRQLLDRRARVERLVAPALERLVHRPRRVEVALMRGEVA